MYVCVWVSEYLWIKSGYFFLYLRNTVINCDKQLFFLFVMNLIWEQSEWSNSFGEKIINWLSFILSGML